MKAVELFTLLKQIDPTVEIRLEWPTGRTGPVRLLIISEKGGVGKTALTIAILLMAANAGLEVALVDLDPRASASNELGVYADDSKQKPDDAIKPDYTVNDLLYVSPEELASDDYDPGDIRGQAAAAFVRPIAAWPQNIRVLAAERALGHREMDHTPGMEHRLAAALDGALDGIDLVVIDSPPRPGGKLVAAGILAATHAIIPTVLDADGYAGIAPALRSIKVTRASFGAPPLPVVGIVRNIAETSKRNVEDITEDDLADNYPDLLLHDVAVPRYGVRRESRLVHVPFTDSSSKEAVYLKRAYTKVLNEVAKAAG